MQANQAVSARFARALAGAEAVKLALAHAEQVTLIERAATDAGFGAEQARLAAEHFAAAARDERRYMIEAAGTPDSDDERPDGGQVPATWGAEHDALYDEALRRFGARCLWNAKPGRTLDGLRAVARRLKTYGDMAACRAHRGAGRPCFRMRSGAGGMPTPG